HGVEARVGGRHPPSPRAPRLPGLALRAGPPRLALPLHRQGAELDEGRCAMKRRERFVPANPTLWPEMLLGRGGVDGMYPSSASRVRYFYFARNAIWTLAREVGLDRSERGGGEVLVPAYHHGVEVEALVDAGTRPVFYRVGRAWDVDVEDVAR